jgi:hypothetical protein
MTSIKEGIVTIIEVVSDRLSLISWLIFGSVVIFKYCPQKEPIILTLACANLPGIILHGFSTNPLIKILNNNSCEIIY